MLLREIELMISSNFVLLGSQHQSVVMGNSQRPLFEGVLSALAHSWNLHFSHEGRTPLL
jgi:hypothetical protein